MTKNPFLNALAAAVYIVLVATVISSASGHPNPNNSVIIPIAVVSLFTLSAAVMCYLFVYQPFTLYLDGKKKQAVNLFLQTIAVFAGLTAIVFILLFAGILK